jgi:hypothetical protein
MTPESDKDAISLPPSSACGSDCEATSCQLTSSATLAVSKTLATSNRLHEMKAAVVLGMLI